jgi:hypothetical protein
MCLYLKPGKQNFGYSRKRGGLNNVLGTAGRKNNNQKLVSAGMKPRRYIQKLPIHPSIRHQTHRLEIQKLISAQL